MIQNNADARAIARNILENKSTIVKPWTCEQCYWKSLETCKVCKQ